MSLWKNYLFNKIPVYRSRLCTRGFKFWPSEGEVGSSLPRKYQAGHADKRSYLNKVEVRNEINYYSYATLFFPITCFALGVWQIRRKIWKTKLVEAMAQRSYLPVTEIPEDLTDRIHMEFRKVKVRGTFDHSRELYIGPRSKMVDNKFAASPMLMMPTDPDSESNIGFIVVTPLKLAGRNEEILVNRGWVPSSKRDPRCRLEGQIEGEVEFEGIVRLTEERKGTGSPKHDRNSFRYRDLTLLAEAAGTSFFYVDATFESTVPGGPLGGQTQITLKDDHLQYVFTWLLCGTITSYMWYQRFILKLMT